MMNNGRTVRSNESWPGINERTGSNRGKEHMYVDKGTAKVMARKSGKDGTSEEKQIKGNGEARNSRTRDVYEDVGTVEKMK